MAWNQQAWILVRYSYVILSDETISHAWNVRVKIIMIHRPWDHTRGVTMRESSLRENITFEGTYTERLRVGILWEFFPTLFCVNFGKFTQNSHQNENDYVWILWEFVGIPTRFVWICENSHKICVNFEGILWEFCVNFNKKGWLARSEDEILLFIYFITYIYFGRRKW